MGVRIAQGPEVVGGGEDQIQREHREPAGDPADGGGDGRRRHPRRCAAISAVISANIRSLSVCPPTRSVTPRSASRASSWSSPPKAPLCANSLPSCANGWVLSIGVRAGAGVPDVRDERAAARSRGRSGELGVLPGGDRLLVHDRPAVGVEDPDAGTVRLPVALLAQAVRRIQQPEGGGDRIRPRRAIRIVGTLWFSLLPAAPRPVRPCQVSAGAAAESPYCLDICTSGSFRMSAYCDWNPEFRAPPMEKTPLSKLSLAALSIKITALSDTAGSGMFAQRLPGNEQDQTDVAETTPKIPYFLDSVAWATRFTARRAGFWLVSPDRVAQRGAEYPSWRPNGRTAPNNSRRWCM